MFIHKPHTETVSVIPTVLCCVPGVQMYLCNKQRYGYLNVPAKPHQTNEDDRGNFVHLQLEAMSEWGSSSSPASEPFYVGFSIFDGLCCFSGKVFKLNNVRKITVLVANLYTDNKMKGINSSPMLTSSKFSSKNRSRMGVCTFTQGRYPGF